MRSFTFIHVLLIFILLLAYTCSQAQDYAITAAGDTLRGEVRVFNSGPDKKVQVLSEGKKKTSVRLLQVRRFQSENEIYEPVKGPLGYAFMKLVKEGYLNYYLFQRDNQVTYDGQFLVKRDGTTLEVSNINFKKSLSRFLQDCEEVEADVEAGKYSRKEIEKIVEAYNACVMRRTVDHSKIISDNTIIEKKALSWEQLLGKVNEQDDFAGKSDAVEMITEIIAKTKRSEKIPNFMIEGLRNSLKQTTLSEDLESTLLQMK
jgi:hypothetical protein